MRFFLISIFFCGDDHEINQGLKIKFYALLYQSLAGSRWVFFGGEIVKIEFIDIYLCAAQ